MVLLPTKQLKTHAQAHTNAPTATQICARRSDIHHCQMVSLQRVGCLMHTHTHTLTHPVAHTPREKHTHTHVRRHRDTHFPDGSKIALSPPLQLGVCVSRSRRLMTESSGGKDGQTEAAWWNPPHPHAPFLSFSWSTEPWARVQDEESHLVVC